MKRKQPSAKTPAPAAATAGKGKAKAAAKAVAAPAPPQKKSQSFAKPMRPLYSDDSDDEGVESARHDRRHMQQIDADADGAEDDQEELEDDEEDSDAEDEQDAEAAAEDEEDEDADSQDEEEAGEDDEMDNEEGAAAIWDFEPESEEEIPLELDLPLQLVQGTYSGVLYGLKTKDTLRSVRKYHAKLHSKGGLEETDVEVDEADEDAEPEDEEDAADAAMLDGDSLPHPDYEKPAADPNSATSSFGLLFTNAAHIGSIKSLAISGDGKWMVSGGMDETIKIYKTAVMREFGQLHSHSGSVSALEFYGSSFLLSGGQEGDLCLWSTKTWQMLRKFESAHTGAPGSTGGVSCLAVHPSGRVALSVGAADRKVKLWDLMKGSLASERTLDFACTAVRWAVGGECYALMGDKRFDIYDTASKLLRREEVTDTKLHSAAWLSHNLLALGCEDKSVRIYLATTGDCIATLQAHQARVRGLDAISVPVSSEADAARCTFLASADTNGQTYMWDLTSLVDAAATGSARGVPAIHPCCSSFHDQRVTLLRILPQWVARKEDESLKKPVQTAAAAERQQQLMDKKAAAAAANGGDAATSASSSKADREAAKKARAKALFEKGQRSHAAREAAAAKAKRTLARLAPHADLEELDALDQPKKKKAKHDFEVAPMADSDQEQEEQLRSSDDEEEVQTKPVKQSSKPVAPQKKAPAAAAAPTPAKPAAAAAAPAAKQQPVKAAAKVASKPAGKKGAAPATAGKSVESDHSGFSAAMPMFRPKLNDQKKKNKSAKKIQRDADRSKAQKGRG